MFVYLSGYLPTPAEFLYLSRYQSIPFGIGLSLLYVALFTLTIDSPFYHYLRLALLPVIVYNFWEACSIYHAFPSAIMVVGIATVCGYAILLAVRHSAIQLCDPIEPRWVETKKEGETTVRIYRKPQTFRERLLYALDLLSSLRGTSWLAGESIEWDWVHPKHRISNTTTRISRGRFFKNSLRDFILLFFALDFLDILTKSRTWDWRRPDALYSIPLLYQCIHAYSLCVGTTILMLIDYTFTSTLAVGVFDMDPIAWPPLFCSPFQAISLTDFWSHRWHWIFRRTFAQMSIPAIQLVQKLSGSRRGLSVVITRAFCAFGVSAVLHCFIMFHTQRWTVLKLGDGKLDQVTFWDSDVLSFFMVQPLGMIFEQTVLAIILDALFPPLQSSTHKSEKSVINGDSGTVEQANLRTNLPPRWEKVLISRILTWSFLIWTGRWWTNKWIRVGLFDDGAKITPFSPLRSLWYQKLIR